MPSTLTAEEKKAKRRADKNLRAKLRKQTKRRDVALSELYDNRPITEWDDEELARGRPRARDGSFRGVAPQWVNRQVHEEAVNRFTGIAQGRLRAIVPEAIALVERLIREDGKDDKGRPLVPASVRLEAAKWAVEHLVGKPTQRVETDISVKLQGILANVIVSGSSGAPLELEVPSWEDDDEASGADDLG